MPFLVEINKLQNELENIKDKVSKNELILYFAKDDTEALLEEEHSLKAIFKDVGADQEYMDKLNRLITQTKQFIEDLDDLISLNNSL